jgi:hypothetical protein
MIIKQEVLDILACPLCKADVKVDGSKLACTNPQCLCRYRIEDDIPTMLIDEAERPCPKCGAQRDWLEEQNLLQCPKCGCNIKGR